MRALFHILGIWYFYLLFTEKKKDIVDRVNLAVDRGISMVYITMGKYYVPYYRNTSNEVSYLTV